MTADELRDKIEQIYMLALDREVFTSEGKRYDEIRDEIIRAFKEEYERGFQDGCEEVELRGPRQ